MPEPDLLQQQRQIIRDFLRATANRVTAEAETGKQFEREQAEMEAWLEEQKQAGRQQKAETQTRYEDERQAADDDLAQAKERASALLRQAQASMQKAKKAETDVNLPQAISFSARTAPTFEPAGNPKTELHAGAKQAEQAGEEVRNAVAAWSAWQASEMKRKNERRQRLAVLSALAILVIFLSVWGISNRVQERHQMPSPLRDLRSRLGMEFVYVPAGEFIMGSLAGQGGLDELPQHQVMKINYLFR